MKTTFAIIAGLLATSISAAPSIKKARQTFNVVTVQLSNDQSGANAAVTIAADGAPRSIDDLFGNTAVGSNGANVIATSTQLTAFQQDTACTITLNGAIIANLNAQQTFVDLDGNPNALTPINLDGGVLTCVDS